MSEEMKHVVDRSTAELEFERWATAMRIDLDTEGVDENERRDSERDRILFIKSIMSGVLVVDENGQAVFTPLDGKEIVFKKPKGSLLPAMDKAKKNADAGKLFNAMADMTGSPSHTFSKMDYADTRICLAIFTLFLA